MASIYPRKNKDGSVRYRMVIRKKGVPTLCLTFPTLEEANEWVKFHEHVYIRNPNEYIRTRNKHVIWIPLPWWYQSIPKVSGGVPT